MMLEKMPSGTTHAQGFDLEPVIVNDVTEASGAGLPSKDNDITHKDTIDIAAQSSVQEDQALDSQLQESTHETLNLQPVKTVEEDRGFSLQPVANLVESIRTEEEDIPPAESLRGIKSIAHARRSAGLEENVKKERNKSVSVKKSRTLGDTKRTTDSVSLKKGKWKSERDEYQPSPSSVPTWSPTPTMRKDMRKVNTDKHMCGL